MRARTLATTVALAAAVSLALGGCAVSKGATVRADGTIDGTGQTLNVLVGIDTVYPKQQKQWQAEMAKEFKKTTGATLKYDTYASANDELTRIQTSVVSGQGPDVYSIGTTFTPTAYSLGAFVKLTAKDWNSIGGRAKFEQASLGISGPSQKEQIGIPVASRPFVMAYNKELLAKAGISKPATTWDQFAAQAKKLTGHGVYGIATDYADGFDPYKFTWAMSLQSGNPVVSKAGKATIDDATMVKAYQTYFGWLTKDHSVDPAAVGWNGAQALAAFADGKAAYLPMTTAASAPSLNQSKVKGKYAYAVMPTVPPGASTLPSQGRAAASILSGDNVVVANYSKNQALAFAYVKQVTAEQEQLDFYKTFGQLPTNAAAAAQLEKSDPTLKPVVRAGKQSIATPFTGAWSDIQLALVNINTQLIPSLKKGSVSTSQLKSQLKTAQQAADSSLAQQQQ
ncbi:ABC transporter substrate-binding protein [Frondihabitans australicus]|uniref:Carbohydrate ABC transporter substrate-binding protein (CUT1 family) n=1 Tax=Frondihabitans australicus TaxID=386892 RepID=A0A495IGR4_9MICO|nr:extracellular solute-binding protein [Frondihabitans australicus]RKR74345.1 carbohydrate ABC transporter substrate-binding protein (CUT1 family) [Frondihabitans australicus]